MQTLVPPLSIRTLPRNAAKSMMGILVALFTGGPCSQAISADLGQAISFDERITLFARAAVKSGLDDVLKQPGPFIAFIP